MFPIVQFPAELLSELSVSADGKAFASGRATARLCGVVSENAIRNWLRRIEDAQPALPKMLQPFSGQSFEGAQLPDTLVSAFIKYYAYQGRETAQRWDMVLSAIGLRTAIQQAKGYSQPVEPRRPAEPQPLQLADEITLSKHVMEIQDRLSHLQPRLAQVMTDHFVNRLVELKQPALPSGPRLRGVVEIARDLGYQTDESSRVKLGKFVANSFVGHLSQKEERLCNGVQTLINCYPDTPGVRDVIAQFFS